MPGRGETGWERIYAVVRRIPRGRVATYGDVAAAAGCPGRAREVGWALHALDAESRVPWQRVVNARGELSPRGEPAALRVQRALLEREGVRLGLHGRIDLAKYAWRPRSGGSIRARQARSARREAPPGEGRAPASKAAKRPRREAQPSKGRAPASLGRR